MNAATNEPALPEVEQTEASENKGDTPAPVDPTPTMERAARAFRAFVEARDKSARLVGLHDSDADGVTAGVVWQRLHERLGFSDVLRLSPDRERNAWSPKNHALLEAAAPDALCVMDLGSQPILPLTGVPTCYIDHHFPGDVRDGATLISAYTWNPIPTSSLLVYELAQTLADVSDLDWVAAIGVLSDLGDKAPFAILDTTRKKYTAKYLKEATALVNAARRSSQYNPEAAARAILTARDPKELVQSDNSDAQILRSSRAEVKASMEEAKKAAPLFAGQVALIRVHSGCQVHPLIAQVWRSRLPKYIVICANDRYMPDRVNFSARGATGTNVLAFLRSFDLGEGEGNFGHGHDQASGGSLPVPRWNLLLEKMGFPSSVFAS